MASTHDPPASSGSKTFGIHKYNPEYCLGSGAQREDRRRGYEDKYEDDALYEELGDDARIWRVMLDEGRANDAAMLQRFRDHLDVDLVFAGLFSAIVTNFVVQTSQTPSNTGDTTVALLLEIIAIQRAWANDPRVEDVASFSVPPSSPDSSPWINRCWYLSLIFSLLAAFGAVVVRQWLQEYESDIIGPPKRRALVRHYRRVGLEKYKVHLIVPILPMLLHVSLLLFFVGLTLYVRRSDRTMSNGIIALTAMIYVVYLGTNILPVFRPQCPYRSPLSTGAQWAKSLVALLYALLPARSKIKALLQFFLQNISSAVSHVHALEVFKAPDAHEWEAVLNSSDRMIPDSLDSMAQASSDLSVTPLIVQASSSLPIDRPHYDNYNFEDPRYKELLRRRILPWFVNALSTRHMVFDWAPGRENELQRMACALLLVPLDFSHKSTCFTVLWEEIDANQYRTCILRVLQALTSALLDLPTTPTVTMTDVATMSMTLLALGNRLDDFDLHLDLKSKLLQDDALFDTITTAYSSLPKSASLAVLRLRPVIWRHAIRYLRDGGWRRHKIAPFAIALWRSADAFRLHVTCHAIDLHIGDGANPNAAFDDNLGFLVVQFLGLFVTTLGYESIDSALRSTGNSAASAAFRSTFVVRPCLSLAMFVKVDARLPASLAVSLFWCLAKLAEATDGHDEKVAVLNALNCHAIDYREVLTEALEYDEISMELLRHLATVVLHDPQMALLDISDALAVSLATRLSKPPNLALSDLPADDMIWCLYLDALCAARAHTAHISSKFPDASRKLHSALLSLRPTYHDTWKSQLAQRFEKRCIPLAVALALKVSHGCNALAEWVDDLPAVVQDPNSGLSVWVPFEALGGGDLNWYRHFTSDTDKYIHSRWNRSSTIPISKLVSFQEAVERMQKTDAERAAREAQQSSQGDGAEAHFNDDAEGPGRGHGTHEDQGDAERTQNKITERIKTFGAWVATSYKSVRPFLGTLDRA
ncbi:hypothetical protein GGG16DRAFT_18134, partial [Schizophyllum commune]